MDSVAQRRDALVAFGVGLITMLRGRADLWDAGVMIEDMESTTEKLHRLSTHYVVTVSNLGDPARYIALAVNLEGWHPIHGKTSQLLHNAYVDPAEFPARLGDLIAEILKKDRELREQPPLF